MKFIKTGAAAEFQSAAGTPRQYGDKQPVGVISVDALTASLRQAMQDYATCLTALTAPGLAEEELKKREATCVLRRAAYLEAKVALETRLVDRAGLGAE
ncbi:hypothetical protein [Noviherbaspirillum aerium]|uniref:hypothetical protein n=1 Tax=Noviherbaspirillum aerium TaxID=2588497 RepID=UPI00124F4C22|nr:hypothetical protein [Noviherbaspirillum aerium]